MRRKALAPRPPDHAGHITLQRQRPSVLEWVGREHFGHLLFEGSESSDVQGLGNV